MHDFEMAIASDLIGVIADTDKAIIRCAKDIYGVDLSSVVIKREVVVKSGLLTEKQYRILQLESASNWEWAKHTELIPGVKDVAIFLQEMRCALAIVTSRSDEVGYPMLSTTVRWLQEQGLMRYLFDVKGVGYHKSKATAIQELRPQPVVYVDDYINKLEPLIGVVEQLFLFTRPHNEYIELPPGIKRVDSWLNIYDVVCEIMSTALTV